MAWITDGESGEDVRAKLNALDIPIDSGTISSPVEYLDIDLPSGYSHFRVVLTNFRWDLYFGFSTNLGAVLSFDGGATFLNDTNNFNSYFGLFFSRNDTGFGSSSGTDSELVWFGPCIPSSDLPPLFVMELSPGDADNLAQVIMTFTAQDENTIYAGEFVGVVNPAATITPVPARANLIRFLPYGNGDSDPPTGGQTFTSGSYFLYGIPTP